MTPEAIEHLIIPAVILLLIFLVLFSSGPEK